MSSVTVPAPSQTEDDRRRRPITSRLAGLANAMEGSRRTSPLDIRQVMLAAGATCMGLGIVAIVLGWYGASHSSYLFQEIPYLISGGLLGVALVAGGGFLFASWFVRMMEDNHRHAARVERTLELVDHVLGAITEDAALASGLESGGRQNGRPAAEGNPAETRARRGDEPMGSYSERAAGDGRGSDGERGPDHSQRKGD